MNYYDDNYVTDKPIQLVIDNGVSKHEYPILMTQNEVAKFCEANDICADAYVDGQWVGSTEI